MDTESWGRWWNNSGEDQLRALVMAVWDPIGVEGAVGAWDEYDGYLPTIGKRLRNAATHEEIAELLAETRKNWSEEPDGPSDFDLAAARKITYWYAAEMHRHGERD